MMKKEVMKKIIADSIERDDVIPGIYNYCDRWCRHCRMKEKCSIFIQEQVVLARLDMDAESEIMMVLEISKDMLGEAMDEMGGKKNERYDVRRVE